MLTTLESNRRSSSVSTTGLTADDIDKDLFMTTPLREDVATRGRGGTAQ
jgi:hypothetical protein